MWSVWVGGAERESRNMGLKEVSLLICSSRSVVDVGGETGLLEQVGGNIALNSKPF